MGIVFKHEPNKNNEILYHYCKNTCFNSTRFFSFPVFQLSVGILPATGCSGIYENARCYIYIDASALLNSCVWNVCKVNINEPFVMASTDNYEKHHGHYLFKEQ